MKQVSVVISTYTSDVSGVCSALYELGGMVVIHDPSGCNSTYNTHDEPRWFDQDSLIFISGLAQMDAVMGNDDKFVEDVVRAAKELDPRFIALVRSPIPLMIGTDFDGIAREIESMCGIPTFFIPTTGMRSYIKGAGMALEKMVQEFMPEKIADKIDQERVSLKHESDTFDSERFDSGISDKAEALNIRLNLMGATPLDFSIDGTYEALKETLSQEGFKIHGSLAYQTSYQEMQTLPEADVNLVLTACGLPAAIVMKERYGIPYVVGFPAGSMRNALVEAIKDAKASGRSWNLEDVIAVNRDSRRGILSDREPLVSQEDETGNTYGEKQAIKHGVIIHEPVIAASLARSLSDKYAVRITPVTMLETSNALMTKDLLCIDSEEDMQAYLKDVDFVIADPMFQPICPKDLPFYSLPHEAFSGRTYRKQMKNLMTIE